MFKPRPYDPDRVSKQTPAQQAATERNFRVFKLHGLHAQMFMLTGPRRELARLLVDQELIAMGAQTTAEAGAARRAKILRRREREQAERRKNPHSCTGAEDCLCENCLDIPF